MTHAFPLDLAGRLMSKDSVEPREGRKAMRAIASRFGMGEWRERFHRLTLSHMRALLALMIVSFCLFLPGQMALQPMDRDEPRFAQASK